MCVTSPAAPALRPTICPLRDARDTLPGQRPKRAGHRPAPRRAHGRASGEGRTCGRRKVAMCGGVPTVKACGAVVPPPLSCRAGNIASGGLAPASPARRTSRRTPHNLSAGTARAQSGAPAWPERRLPRRHAPIPPRTIAQARRCARTPPGRHGLVHAPADSAGERQGLTREPDSAPCARARRPRRCSPLLGHRLASGNPLMALQQADGRRREEAR